MVRKVNLQSFLPEFMQEYKEVLAIMQTENPEVQALEDETEILMDNQFLFTMNEDCITRMERITGIIPSNEDELEDRRKNIYLKMNTQLPYSIGNFQRMLTAISKNGYEIELNPGEYKISVTLTTASLSSYNYVKNMMKKVLPCNLIQEIRVKYNSHSILHKYKHSELANYTQEEIRSHYFTERRGCK